MNIAIPGKIHCKICLKDMKAFDLARINLEQLTT